MRFHVWAHPILLTLYHKHFPRILSDQLVSLQNPRCGRKSHVCLSEHSISHNRVLSGAWLPIDGNVCERSIRLIRFFRCASSIQLEAMYVNNTI